MQSKVKHLRRTKNYLIISTDRFKKKGCIGKKSCYSVLLVFEQGNSNSYYFNSIYFLPEYGIRSD